ncbi:MAG TPA: S1 RNA-binding domain-containing protein, partial [Lamprocystis sp. (in: g-proteobacteria)]|nr:S1 RNA-binding domain-containing protein [Lamprocystis sp. (in: g-proteobacteria)]
TATLRRMDAKEFTDDRFGLPTVQDILSELQKPGRDPRPEFKAAVFREGVETLKDLQTDMILEGTVTNVTNFGAFVDIGVHQDGLVHISMLSDQFVKDPHQVVKSGDLVKVKVMEVDLERKRIALSMRLGESSERRGGQSGRDRPAPPTHVGQRAQPSRPLEQARRPGGDRRPAPQRQPPEQPAPAGGAFAAAFEKARKG